jgi:RND family efflux transporter MFP subunit
MTMTRMMLLLPSLFLLGCGGKPTPPAKGRPALMFTVDVLPIESKKVDYIVQAPGSIDAFERVQVTARVAGVVDRVLFAEGQQVKKGAALVSIDGERYGLAVAQSKAALQKAQATQADAEAMVARREGATQDHPGLIPGEELASDKTKVLTAKADTEVAAQALKTAQVNLRDSSVVAPIEGIIQTRTVETGQYVQAGYVMATLLREDPMLLRFQVEPEDAPRLKPGMLASFTMRETQRTFNAKLTLVSGAADSATHMVAVTGEVNDTEHKYWLRPGSFCDVTVDIGAKREAPLIPRSAARATDHGYVAYVVDGDTAKEHPLTLGMSTKEGWVEIRAGLKAGELLVVHGAEALSNGAKVHATKVTAASLGAPAASDGGVQMSGNDK